MFRGSGFDVHASGHRCDRCLWAGLNTRMRQRALCAKIPSTVVAQEQWDVLVTLLWVGVQRRCLVGFSIGCLALLCILLGSVAVTAIQIVANFTIFLALTRTVD